MSVTVMMWVASLNAVPWPGSPGTRSYTCCEDCSRLGCLHCNLGTENTRAALVYTLSCLGASPDVTSFRWRQLQEALGYLAEHWA